MVSTIPYRVEESSRVQIEERLGVEALTTMIMYFDSDGIKEYGSLVMELDRGNICFKPKKFELDMHIKNFHPRNRLLRRLYHLI